MSRLDYPIEWHIGTRELVLNGHRTTDGEVDRSKLSRTYLVEVYDFSPLDIREQRQGLHLLTGGDFGPATRQFRHMSLRGVIKAESGAMLEDMESEFLSAFDIEQAQADAPTTFGTGTLIHRSPTQVSATDIGTVVREGFYCRPENYPITYARRGARSHVRAFAVQLAAAYPYRVLFPEREVTFSASAGWSQELPNWTTKQGGRSRLTFEVTTSGNGASNFTISDGSRSLVLDLSSAGALTPLTIEMWSKQMYEGSTQKPQLRTSNVDSFLADIPGGGVTVAISNTTNVTQVLAKYHQTRA